MMNQKALAAALASVVAIVERRNTIPILSNVLIEATGDRVRFTATDMDVFVSRELDAPDIGTWTTTAPALSLLSLIKGAAKDCAIAFLPPDETDPRFRVMLGGRNTVQLPVLDVDGFPRLTPGDTVATVMANAADLIPLLKTATPFIAKDSERRTALTGMNLSSGPDGGVTLTATNGAKLFQRNVRGATLEGELPGSILPRKTVELLGKHGPTTGDVWIEVTARAARITAGDLEISTKLIDGIYPAFVAPDRQPAFTINVTDLIKAVELVTTVCDLGAKPFLLSVNGDDVRVAAAGHGENLQGETFVECAGEGLTFDVGMSAPVFLASMKTFKKADLVILEWAGEGLPVVFRSAADADIEAIVSPYAIRKADMDMDIVTLDRPDVGFTAPEQVRVGGEKIESYGYRVTVQRRSRGEAEVRELRFPTMIAAQRAYRRHVAAARIRCDVQAEPIQTDIAQSYEIRFAEGVSRFIDIPAAGYVQLSAEHLAERERRVRRLWEAEHTFETTTDEDVPWTRAVFRLKDVSELAPSPRLTVARCRTKALRDIGERRLRQAEAVPANDHVTPEVEIPAAAEPVAAAETVVELEPVSEGFIELTAEYLASLAERAERLEAAKAVFEITNDNDVPWTRKLLGLKLRDAVEPTPMLTVLKGRTGPIRALGATALKRAA